ncbi:TPA: sigma-70 family RNA polymerase sigma factor [bacterium]|nr:sigma-70 family RNA polymerase sigma factor [bacterium]
MSKYKVTITGIDTSKLEVLKEEEIKALLHDYLNNKNESALEKLVMGNLKLVLSSVKRFSNRVDNLDDIFQIGCIGLIKAINNFNLSLNLRFSTYAVPMIVGEIKRYLRDNTQLRISRQLKDLAYHAMKVKEEYLIKEQRELTTEEIAEKLGVKVYQLVEALESIQSVTSIFEPINNDSGDAIYVIDIIPDKADAEEKILNRLSLQRGLNSLSQMQRKVISDRYFNGKTQFEIASEFDISQAQVSRIEKSALKVLKEYF